MYMRQTWTNTLKQEGFWDTYIHEGGEYKVWQQMISQNFQMLNLISRDNNLISEVRVTLSILSPVYRSSVTICGRLSTRFSRTDVTLIILQFSKVHEKFLLF